jgi:phosphosulfolactate phosphohydrolase-like enzyme
MEVSPRMNSKSVLAGFAILFVTPFGQQPLQRAHDPNDMITFHGGSGSHMLPNCQAAVRLGSSNAAISIEPTATDIKAAIDGSYCAGFVVGVVDTLMSASLTSKTTYCIPTNADNDQLIRVVSKYLNDNPAKLNEPASFLVTGAMIDAFPCK